MANIGNYDFKKEEGDKLEVSKYRLKVVEADKMTSKNGRDMLALKFAVSGKQIPLYHYIVFLDDTPERRTITNKNLTQFFESFGINMDNGEWKETANYIGKVGACQTKESEYNGEISIKVHYFLSKKEQAELPPWVEVGGNAPKMSDLKKADDVDEGDIPF